MKAKYFSPKTKKAQVTLFVILSVVIVLGVIILFIFRPYLLGDSAIVSNPEGYIQKCAIDSVKKTEDLLLKNNFNLNKNFTNFYSYKSEKVPYLCTSQEFYIPCIPQEPGLFSKMQNLLENRAMVDVQNCYNILRKEFSSRGYSIEEGDLSLRISLLENSISGDISKKFIAKQGENSVSLSSLNFDKQSSFYSLTKTAQTIVNYESTICEFNEMNWMMAMHDVLISKFVGSDSTKVYTLKNRYTEQEIKFAIRTCVMPAGI